MNGWKHTRLKEILSSPLVYGLNVSSEHDDRDMPRYIRITDFDDNNNLLDDTFKSLPYDLAEPAMLKDGDLLFARSGATVGKTFLYSNLPYGACYAGYLIRARFNKRLANPKYISYYTKSQSYINWKNKVYIQATIQNISAEKYNQLSIIIPPLSEQNRIVAYLDEKTAAIDKQVLLLEQKAKKYEQLKKSLISHTVTRGLNKNVRLKDSGIDWIGQIPEHWEVKRLKEIVRSISSGGTPTSSNENFYADDGTPWVSIGDMSMVDVVNSTEKKLTSLGIADKSLIVYPTGTLLYSIFASIGKVSELGIDATINQAILALELKRGQNQRYIKYQLQAMESYAVSQANGNTQLNLNAGIIRRFKLALPPLSEQRAIADYLDEKCAKIDAIVANINQQIEKYKLLRRALINEVVTGQRAV